VAGEERGTGMPRKVLFIGKEIPQELLGQAARGEIELVAVRTAQEAEEVLLTRWGVSIVTEAQADSSQA